MKNDKDKQENQETIDDNVEKIFCKRCGRLLRGESSIDRQFGPRCYKLWLKERSQQIQLFGQGGDENV